MNKYQEALDYLAVSLQVFDETVDDKPYRDELDSKRETARKELQELVYKATPKKPDYWGDGIETDDGSTPFDHWDCPHCHHDLNYEEHIFCPNCGQAIDWSNE